MDDKQNEMTMRRGRFYVATSYVVSYTIYDSTAARSAQRGR